MPVRISPLRAAFAVFLLSCAATPAFAVQPTEPGADPAADTAPGHYASVNGLRLYYEIHGAGGTPLVLLHGGGSTIETTFAKVLPSLAKTRQVIAFEQQGHGRTADIADRPFTFEQSADDTAALLEQLNIQQADLFGFSNGGNIALQVAIRHPARVRKLIVASAMFKRDGLYPEVWEFMKRSTLQTMPAVLQDAYRKTAPHPEQLQSFHDKSARRMLDFKDWPEGDIRSIQAPTLIMIGDADSVRPEHAVEMFRLLLHPQLAVIPGGHGAYIGEVSAGRRTDSQVQFDTTGTSGKTQSKVPELTVALIAEFLDAPPPELRPAQATGSSSKPEDWPRLFEQRLNAGDLDGVVALYDPGARFVTQTGATLLGRDQIRPVLAGMISSKARLQSRVVKAVTSGDIAVLYTNFDGTTTDANGKSEQARYQAIEVLRRQPSGEWKLIMGDPHGRD